jgi:Ser/Thr protein kinase RdoA (MazF antagonist)
MLAHLCSFYSLGSLLAPPERVPGGLIHRLYRVRTTRGPFAVKLLSADALAEPGFRARVQNGERIAQAVAAASLPAVAALEVAGAPLHDLPDIAETGKTTVLVYPWVDGQPLPASITDPHRARQIGAILGQMHGLDLHSLAEPLPSPVALTFTTDEWAHLADQARHAGADWAGLLQDALPDLERWGNLYTKAQQALAGPWSLSHGDLHQQNVLWTDKDTPWLIDWESAGWQQPAKEAVVCALEWSGFVEGAPNLPAFRTFLDAYRRAFPLDTTDALHGLDACFGNWLGWLRFCTQRALGTITTDPEEQAEGARQVIGTLATVRRVEHLLPTLRHACQ